MPFDALYMTACSNLIAVASLYGAYAMAAEGLTTLPSVSGPKDTMDRLEAEVKAKGMGAFGGFTSLTPRTASGR